MTATRDALAGESGTFLMVAMDQRASLRTMLAEPGHHATDERLVQFKLAVARELGPYASGLLVDDACGAHVVEQAVRLVSPSCGVLLAVDLLDQPPGGVVQDTRLDERAAGRKGCRAEAARDLARQRAARGVRRDRSALRRAGGAPRASLGALQGVAPDDVPRAVEAACRGGAPAHGRPWREQP